MKHYQLYHKCYINYYKRYKNYHVCNIKPI